MTHNLQPFAVRKTLLLGFVTLIAIMVATIEISSFNTTSAQVSGGRDHSTNSIISGGALSKSEYIGKLRANTPTDSQGIANYFGLAPNEYDRFLRDAQPGIAYKDGRIEVNGRTVVTNAWSIGREQKSYSTPLPIYGVGTYHKSSSSNVFASNTIKATVLLDEKGNFEFAYLDACANPITGTPNNPSFACNALNKRELSRDTYKFSTNASVGNGAKITKVVYSFGDGNTRTETNPNTEVTHQYAKAGTYQAKVTVYVSLPTGGTYIIAASGNCVQPVTVKPEPPTPAFICENIVVRKIAYNRYGFRANAAVFNGAKVTRIVLDFGDGKTHNIANPGANIKPTMEIVHEYNEAKSYNMKATVFATPSDATNRGGNCRTAIPVPGPVASCKVMTVAKIPNKYDAYNFSSAVTMENGAKLKNVTYDFGDGSKTVVKTNPSDKVPYTYSKPGSWNARVTANFSLPNGKSSSDSCTAKIKVDATYACTLLKPEVINADKTKFRFTTAYTTRNAQVISADYTVDGSATKATVRPNSAGVIAREYTFADGKTHKVDVLVKFTVGSTTKTDACSAKVTGGQTPMCPVPGKELLPPNDPACFVPCDVPGKENLPVGHPDCVPPVVVTTGEPPLPTTGPGEVGLMFAGIAALGAGAHYVMRRRSDHINELALATANDDPAVLESFIAQQHVNPEEAHIAEQEYNHLHPAYTKRGGHHRLISKAHGQTKHPLDHLKDK